MKGAGPSILEGRGSYASVRPDSPKFASSEYVSSSGHGFSHKGDQFYAEKVPEYAGIDRRQYGDRQSTYLGRDLQSEPTGRYADSLGLHQNQVWHLHYFLTSLLCSINIIYFVIEIADFFFFCIYDNICLFCFTYQKKIFVRFANKK